MTCQVCRREEYGEECGPHGTDPCPCCGMVVIAEAGDDEYNPEEPEEIEQVE